MQKKIYKSAIALLITVFFVMLISLSLGVGLSYVNKSSQSMKSESLMLQSSVILDDFLKILKTSPDLNEVKDRDTLSVFLAQASILPFESNGIRVLIEISSARKKINPKELNRVDRLNIFKTFLIKNMINVEYADMLNDLTSGIKEDNLYNTDIFNENPYLFREYIASDKHLLKLNEIYKRKYHDNSLKNVDMLNLFQTGKDNNSSDNNSSIDLNYATPLVWQLITGCDVERSNTLGASGYMAYSSYEDLMLSDDEKLSISKFNTNFYNPIVDIKININKKDEDIIIEFEYNIKKKEGSNFVFKV